MLAIWTSANITQTCGFVDSKSRYASLHSPCEQAWAGQSEGSGLTLAQRPTPIILLLTNACVLSHYVLGSFVTQQSLLIHVLGSFVTQHSSLIHISLSAVLYRTITSVIIAK